MLQAISYAPKRLLGYNIEDEEDMSPSALGIYVCPHQTYFVQAYYVYRYRSSIM